MVTEAGSWFFSWEFNSSLPMLFRSRERFEWTWTIKHKPAEISHWVGHSKVLQDHEVLCYALLKCDISTGWYYLMINGEWKPYPFLLVYLAVSNWYKTFSAWYTIDHPVHWCCWSSGTLMLTAAESLLTARRYRLYRYPLILVIFVSQSWFLRIPSMLWNSVL